jgi:hypothetical protein
VYLDTQDVLGYYGSPYWEAYPIGEDTGRFDITDSEGLIAAIVEELNTETKTAEV